MFMIGSDIQKKISKIYHYKRELTPDNHKKVEVGIYNLLANVGKGLGGDSSFFALKMDSEVG